MPTRDRKVLLTQIMNQRRTQKPDSQSCSGEQPETLPSRDTIETTQMIETRIYVGLNDADTKAQKHETGKYIRNYRTIRRHIPIGTCFAALAVPFPTRS